MNRQPRDNAGRWIAAEHDAPGSLQQLGACILIIATIAASILL